MVNINIQKKDLWLLSAIMVFLVGVAVIVAYNPSGTGGTPSIMGHSADEIEGGGGISFGDWETKSFNTAYYANTDGFVASYGSTLGGNCVIQLFVGPTDNPNTEVVRDQYTPDGGFVAPVKKETYWKVRRDCASGIVRWMSVGS